MEIRQLQVFLTCAEKGSISRAAEELYTSQPHVSQIIGALERELGVTLFRRTGSGVTLTQEGEHILFYAENVLKNAALLRQACAEKPRRALRIAANPSSRLAHLADTFYRNHRDIELSMQYTECSIEQCMTLLRERQYDLGFLFLPKNKLPAFDQMAQRYRLVFTPLLQSDLVLHCGKAGPYYTRERIAPEELGICRCVQMEDDFFSVEDLLLEHPAFRSGKCALDKVVRTNSDHMMVDILQNTDLCNVGSYWLHRPGEQLCRIDGFQGQVSFGYLKSESRPLSEAAETFLTMLKETMAQA